MIQGDSTGRREKVGAISPQPGFAIRINLLKKLAGGLRAEVHKVLATPPPQVGKIEGRHEFTAIAYFYFVRLEKQAQQGAV